MAEQQQYPEYSVVLSSEELFYLLSLLDQETIISFDASALLALTDDQLDLVMTAVRNALRARQLIRVTEEAAPAIQETLLATLGLCAFPRSMVTIYHWQSNSGLPAAITGYLGVDGAALHTEPEPSLHFLARSSSKDGLLTLLAEFCAWGKATGTETYEIKMAADAFMQMRLAAEANQLEDARRLGSVGGVGAATDALVETLANAPAASIVRTVKHDEQGESTTDLTVLQGDAALWMIRSTNGADARQVIVRTIRPEELLEILTASL